MKSKKDYFKGLCSDIGYGALFIILVIVTIVAFVLLLLKSAADWLKFWSEQKLKNRSQPPPTPEKTEVSARRPVVD